MDFLSHLEKKNKLFSQVETESCAAGREQGKESSSELSAAELSTSTFKKGHPLTVPSQESTLRAPAEPLVAAHPL